MRNTSSRCVATERSLGPLLESDFALHHAQARKKYEDDCILINGLNAQARLSQGRDLDKLQTKMEKAEATVQLNERDYRHSCSVLAETTREWVKLWKQFCDLCQDQEEDKAVFVKTNLWDYANALSSACLADDESAERTREALEQCDPDIEARLFVQARGTGSDILGEPSSHPRRRRE